jgi:hypothetical protein
MHNRTTMSNQRLATLVRNHRPLNRIAAADAAGLSACAAVVLSTWRADSPDMVLDHALWLPAMNAVTEATQADDSQVFGAATKVLLGLLGRRPGPLLGSVQKYGEEVLADPEFTAWETMLWFRAGTLVGAANCEPWYAVGGPAPYHDSYTTCLFLAPDLVDRFFGTATRLIEQRGGCVALHSAIQV